MASASLAQTATIVPSSSNRNAYALMSSSLAGTLKYAKPQDLPSYPSFGLKRDGAAAGAAASLGWARSKSFSHWKPDSSESASTAALLANDYKMAPAWEPERSAIGSQAAVLAAGSAQHQRQRQLEPPSAWGSSAANLAFSAGKVSSTSSPPLPGLGRQGSLRAAKGAMASGRARAMSIPQTTKNSYPDQANASANALSAATLAHRPSARTLDVPAENAGAVPYTTMNRLMFTSHPPVKAEVDEQKRADVLHASAVAMARRMYTQQQRMIDTTKAALVRSSSFDRHGAPASAERADEEMSEPMRFDNLQDAAYRLAQERLAKLQDEHDKNRDLQEYYGTPGLPPRHGKVGTIRGKLTRRRAASDSELVDDEKVSQQIRDQMSLFNNKLSKVDERQRTRDREALLAAAQRNVKAQLQGMDKKLYDESGRMAPSFMSSWETKAQAAARARIHASLMDSNAGKIDLGGGKFMDKGEVDEIAAKMVQPILDEITEKAEIERERQAALRLEEERRREEVEKNKQREAEIQAIHKQLKEQQKEDYKAKKAESKQEERIRKEEAKVTKAEQKRVAKDGDGNHKPRGVPADTVAEAKAEQSETTAATEAVAVSTTNKTAISLSKLRIKPRTKDGKGKGKEGENMVLFSPTSDDNSVMLEEEVTSPTAKMRSWFKNRFARPRAKSSSAAAATATATATTGSDGTSEQGGFIGGIALKKLHMGNASVPAFEDRNASMHEVAMADRDEPGEPSAAMAPDARSQAGTVGQGSRRGEGDANLGLVHSVSSLSNSSSDEDRFVEAPTYSHQLERPLSFPRSLKDSASGSGRDSSLGGKESRFKEVM